MSKREEEREESRKRGRVAKVAGYYRPDSLYEIKTGSCKLWNCYADEFQDAECRGLHPNGYLVGVRYILASMVQEITDIRLLRFPLPKPN